MIMKKGLLVIFIFSFLNGYSQKTENEYNKMIDTALSFMVQQMIDSKDISKSHELYLLDENDRPYPYLHSSLIEVKSVDLSSTRKDRRLKKGIRAWKIIPVLKGNRMTITIIDFRISYKSNKYNYSNGGGSEFVFEFSCEKKAWILLTRTSRGL
jgi:hypothetical protein